MKNTRLLLGAALLPTLGAQAQERPNILYIMTDQQGPQVMSCAGNPDLHTPNMDMLASKGVRFTNAYCAFPLSGPSRAAMFTGYMPSQSGMIENEMPLVDSLRNNTLGTLVRDVCRGRVEAVVLLLLEPQDRCIIRRDCKVFREVRTVLKGGLRNLRMRRLLPSCVFAYIVRVDERSDEEERLLSVSVLKIFHT